MKIYLTEKELLDFLSKTLGYPVTGYEIEEASPYSLYVLLLEEVNPLVGPHTKIAAIKKLREIVGREVMGLAEAKYAVEDWPNFLAQVKLHNRIPKVNVEYSADYRSHKTSYSFIK